MKRVLLAEDHSIVIKGLKITFETEFSAYQLEIVRSSANLMKTLRNGDYAMAIIDLHLEDGDTLHLITDLVRIYPELKILVFSGNPEELYAQKLYNTGVRGYLSKQSSDEEVVDAIRQILNGKTYLSENFKEIITSRRYSSTVENPFDKLSQRETEVLVLLITGKKTSEICQELNLQPSTVATYKMKIFTKLNVKNVIELNQLTSNFKVPKS
jgi:two-component system invasion response regulator UvrY